MAFSIIKAQNMTWNSIYLSLHLTSSQIGGKGENLYRTVKIIILYNHFYLLSVGDINRSADTLEQNNNPITLMMQMTRGG